MKEQTKKYLINLCKILLLIMVVCLISFATMSGAEDAGFLKNLLNALPWIILLAFVLLTFWKQFLGGILVVLFGIFTIIFFSALQFIWILFLISLPLIILGGILALLRKKN